MSATPMIHDLVREGRTTPRAGALLLELRRDMSQQRERQRLKKHPVLNVVVLLVVFVLGILGFRKQSA